MIAQTLSQRQSLHLIREVLLDRINCVRSDVTSCYSTLLEYSTIASSVSLFSMTNTFFMTCQFYVSKYLLFCPHPGIPGIIILFTKSSELYPST